MLSIGTEIGARANTTVSTDSVADTLFRAYLRIANGKPVFTADYYAVDGVTGKVSALIDWNDPTHTLGQSTSASQCPLPSPSPKFAGRLALTASVHRYVSSRSSSAWRYLHDGTGCSVMHAVTAGPTTTFAGLSVTGRNNAAVTAHNFYYGASTSVLRPNMLTRNGSSTVAALATATPVIVGVPYWATQDFQAGVEACMYVKNTRTAATYTPPPAAGDPDRTLNFLDGDPALATFPFVGQWVMSGYTNLLTAEHRYILARLMYERFGLA